MVCHGAVARRLTGGSERDAEPLRDFVEQPGLRAGVPLQGVESAGSARTVEALPERVHGGSR